MFITSVLVIHDRFCTIFCFLSARDSKPRAIPRYGLTSTPLNVNNTYTRAHFSPVRTPTDSDGDLHGLTTTILGSGLSLRPQRSLIGPTGDDHQFWAASSLPGQTTCRPAPTAFSARQGPNRHTAASECNAGGGISASVANLTAVASDAGST